MKPRWQKENFPPTREKGSFVRGISEDKSVRRKEETSILGRPSGFFSVTAVNPNNFLDDSCAGRSRNEGNANDPTPISFHDLSADNLIFGPVCSFRQNMGLQDLDQSKGVDFIEKRDEVHKFQPGQYFGSFLFGDDRPLVPLNLSHRAIGIQADDQDIAELFSPPEISDMTDM